MKNRFADNEFYEELFDEGISFTSSDEWLENYFNEYVLRKGRRFMGEWTEEKQQIFEIELEKFKVVNLRLPTLEEESTIWDRVASFKAEEECQLDKQA